MVSKKAILLILVKVYCKIYPGNMIQQIILLKIEKKLHKIFSNYSDGFILS